MAEKRSRRTKPAPTSNAGDSSNDYGLRKRQANAEEAISAADAQSLELLKAIQSAKVADKVMDQSGIRVLSKAEVSSDLRLFKSLPAKPKQPPPVKSEEGAKAKAPKLKGKSAPPGTNFRVPYDKTLVARSRLEDNYMVTEQQYLSVRHAYMERLQEIAEEKEHYRDVLKELEEDVAVNLNKINVVRGSAGLLQQCALAVEAVVKKNAQLEAKLHELEAGGTSGQDGIDKKPVSADMDVDPSESSLADASAENASAEEESKPAPADVFDGLFDYGDSEEVIRSRLGSTVIPTPFGPGSVNRIRTDGMICIQLPFGVGYFNPVHVFVDHAAAEEEVVVKDRRRGKRKNASSNQTEAALVVKTPMTTGAPRGVRLQLSLISNEPDFALAPSQKMNANDLHKQLLERRFDEFVEEDDSNGIPVSWGGPWSTPWAHKKLDGTNTVITRDELASWEEERLRAMQIRGEAIRMRGSITRLRHTLKRKDKIILETKKTQNVLVHRLAIARNELSTLRSRCALVLRDKNGDASPASELAEELANTPGSTSTPGRKSGPRKSVNGAAPVGRPRQSRRFTNGSNGDSTPAENESPTSSDSGEADNPNTKKRGANKAGLDMIVAKAPSEEAQLPSRKRSKRGRKKVASEGGDAGAIGQTRTGKEWK